MTKINPAKLKSSVTGQRFLPQRDPDVLETRNGGGCLAIFGIPFLLAGLFVMQIPLGLIPVENADALPWYFLLPFGAIFAVVGAGLVFGRSGIILDRRRKLIIRWRGLMIPMKQEEQYLDHVKQVSIHKDTGDSDSGDSYPVRLEGDNMKAVDIISPMNYPEARRAAEELAKFLSRPMADFSTGTKIVRDPDKLDESLRERAKRLKEDTSHLPNPPWNMRTRIQETADGLILEIPGPGITRSHWIQFSLVLAFIGFVFYFFMGFFKLPGPALIRYFFLGFFLIFFILGPLWTFLRHLHREARRSTLITVTPALLRVEERAGGKSTVTEIPADALEELDLPPSQGRGGSISWPNRLPQYDLPETGIARLPDGRPMPRILFSLMKLVKSPGITARSDTAGVQFGAGLPEEELHYLHALMKKTLTSK